SVAGGLHRVGCGPVTTPQSAASGGRLMVASVASLQPPLCVDLDGTLIRSDLLLETLLTLIKRNPLFIFKALFWLIQGKAALKAQIAARVVVNPGSLPYDKRLVSWLENERRAGREVWLCTAANEKLAKSVSTYLGIFNGVVASDARANLAGTRKAERLV